MTKRQMLGVAILAMAAPWCAVAFEAALQFNGDVSLGEKGPSLGLRIHTQGWTDTLAGRARLSDAQALVRGALHFRAKTRMVDFGDRAKPCAKGCVTLVGMDARTAVLSADLTSLADQNPEVVCLALEFPPDSVMGQSWTIGDSCRGVFPEKFGVTGLASQKADTFTYVDRVTRKPVVITFAEPVQMVLQDNRAWVNNFSVRFSRLDARRTFPTGDQRAFVCTVSHPDGVTVTHDGPVIVTRGKDWIPIDYRKDILPGTALDFSGMGFNEAPAGKYGWLKAVGDTFEFEKRPGREQRFYGVNLCFDAVVPDADLARQVVTRLRRCGYNSLRIHHYEDPLLQGSKDGVTFNPENLDRFDRLCALAIENGLYLTTDIYVSRRVSWRAVGFDRDGDVPMGIVKALIALHPPAFENWKTFARNFLLHKNPYTGRRYVDEPGLPLISYVNENTMRWGWSHYAKLDCFKAAWRRWLAERRAKDPSFAPNAPDDPCEYKDMHHNAAALCFLADVEKASSRQQRDYLVSLGCKALFTGQNSDDNQPMAAARDAYDYVDMHFYVDHPDFMGPSWGLPSRCDNVNPVQSGWLSPVAISPTRLAEKPFTITEWNFSGPGMYRGMGGILTGAYASLQAWDGLWRFAYSHSSNDMREGKGFPGYFDMAADPLGMASERACLCLFLRQDLGPLADKVALYVGEGECPPDNRLAPNEPDWWNEAWRVQISRTVHHEANGYRTYPLRSVKGKMPFEPAGSKALRLDRKRGSLTIDTPCTSGGFVPSGALDAGAVRFDVGEVAATVWASSLDGQPIRSSKRLLVSHLTDAQAEGNIYADNAKKVLLQWGKNGTVVRNGRAKVSLGLADPTAYEVWELETSGRRLARVPSAVQEGRLVFTAEVESHGHARMLYEVVSIPDRPGTPHRQGRSSNAPRVARLESAPYRSDASHSPVVFIEAVSKPIREGRAPSRPCNCANSVNFRSIRTRRSASLPHVSETLNTTFPRVWGYTKPPDSVNFHHQIGESIFHLKTSDISPYLCASVLKYHQTGKIQLPNLG